MKNKFTGKTPRFVYALCAAAPVILLSAAFFAPFFAPHNPLAVSLENTLAPPCAEYPLGTDELGRCILSRLMTGSRTTLGAAFIIEIIILVCGIFTGMFAGFAGGIFDAVFISIIDILLAFPSVIFALVLSGILGAGLHNVMIAMICVYWVEHARIARSACRALREKEFVLAARAIGCSNSRIIFKHILPEIIPGMLVFSTLHITHIIIALSSLSFLGLGVRPPAPEWGAMLSAQRNYLRENPAAALAVLACLALSAACFQFAGEKLRDVQNPRNDRRIIRIK
ncbi:MAG: ABC transporter permease subunit [Spirochaetaceae bacterium]|jgi:peptide/nickel transport system permease protein|nr:ABC transporter permease subunit [Spirochaetaceae bacterium]